MSLLQIYRDNQQIREFVRFCIVGAFCTALDAVIFYVFRTFASYQVSLVCGYSLSLVVNYFLTIYWTFNTKVSVKNVVGVFSAHLFNLFVVRMGLMRIFVENMNINDRIAYVPTLLISVISNFLIVKFVINRLK